MIVSSQHNATQGRVVLQSDHAALAHQMALAFGNDLFEPIEPRELMEFLVLHHDRGWDETDAGIGRNPHTGLPYSLVNTPLDELLLSGPRSVAFNAAHHPYCGLICSMHIWGLFNGRYGLSDKVVVNMLQGDAKKKAESMLQYILGRQADLRMQLEQNPDTRALIQPEKVMQNYKVLQFFDTFSLYFNEHAGRNHTDTRFLNVPQSATRSATVEVKALGDSVFRLSPYPFARSGLELRHRIYEIPVLGIDVDYRKVFAETPVQIETLKLVA